MRNNNPFGARYLDDNGALRAVKANPTEPLRALAGKTQLEPGSDEIAPFRTARIRFLVTAPRA